MENAINDSLIDSYKESVNESVKSMIEDKEKDFYERNTVSMTEVRGGRVDEVDRIADKFIRRIAEDSGEDALEWRLAIVKNAWAMPEWKMDQIYSRAVRYYRGGILTRYFLACLKREREKSEK